MEGWIQSSGRELKWRWLREWKEGEQVKLRRRRIWQIGQAEGSPIDLSWMEPTYLVLKPNWLYQPTLWQFQTAIDIPSSPSRTQSFSHFCWQKENDWKGIECKSREEKQKKMEVGQNLFFLFVVKAKKIDRKFQMSRFLVLKVRTGGDILYFLQGEVLFGLHLGHCSLIYYNFLDVHLYELVAHVRPFFEKWWQLINKKSEFCFNWFFCCIYFRSAKKPPPISVSSRSNRSICFKKNQRQTLIDVTMNMLHFVLVKSLEIFSRPTSVSCLSPFLQCSGQLADFRRFIFTYQFLSRDCLLFFF